MKDGLANTHPIDDALATAKKEGFAALELCIGLDGIVTPKMTQADCEKIRKQIDSSGVAVQTLASGMTWAVNPTSDDEAVRQHALQLHHAALERAAWLGCQSFLCVPGVVKSPISTDIVRYDRAVERATQLVESLLDTAERVGVDLLVENVWNGLFYSPLEFIDFVDSFKSNRLGIYFDVGNVLGYHQHPPHWIELLGKRIRRVHIKDFKESVGTLAGFCDLLDGDVPFAASMAALRAIGYDKTIVAEMMPWDPTLLTRTSKAMDKILAS
jgi:hexulose-6-phosphate isomerase